VVSAYVVYLKWPQIRRLPWRPAWPGLMLLAAGMLLYLVGVLSTDLYSPTLAFILSLGGVIFLSGGWQALRLLAFPLVLLVFMIPLPQYLTQKLTLPLQLVSSQVATSLLHLIGVPAVRQGNVIDLGVRQLQVVAACSGLRYILALLALGIIFCYFYQRRAWKTALLMIAVIPAAIFANALRVAGMGLYPALQEGFWHGFTGWLIFVFCFACLLFLNKILSWREAPAPLRPPDPDNQGKEFAPADSKPAAAPLLAGLVIILGLGYLGLQLGNIPPVPLKQSFDRFPMELGPWRGKASAIDPAMFQATGASTYLNADYSDGQNPPINLWIAYYENQKGGGAVHSPFSCLTGSGWSLIKEEIAEIAPGKPVRVLLMEQGGQRYLVYYWYLQRGRWLASEYWNKLLLSWDGLTRRRADGALVRLVTPVGSDAPSAQTRLDSFATYLIPLLSSFMVD
jgi:exosortase D (VPLPA-CTERM-specific)